MNRNRRNQRLLENLREAIDQALADSSSVLAAMSELEDAGLNPSFCVNIAIPEQTDDASCEIERPSFDIVGVDEESILTESDEAFLRRLGISDEAMG